MQGAAPELRRPGFEPGLLGDEASEEATYCAALHHWSLSFYLFICEMLLCVLGFPFGNSLSKYNGVSILLGVSRIGRQFTP